jgi:hypothetical protein
VFSNLVTVFYNRYATILENRFRLQEVFTAEPEFVNFLESVAGLLQKFTCSGSGKWKYTSYSSSLLFSHGEIFLEQLL